MKIHTIGNQNIDMCFTLRKECCQRSNTNLPLPFSSIPVNITSGNVGSQNASFALELHKTNAQWQSTSRRVPGLIFTKKQAMVTHYPWVTITNITQCIIKNIYIKMLTQCFTYYLAQLLSTPQNYFQISIQLYLLPGNTIIALQHRPPYPDNHHH